MKKTLKGKIVSLKQNKTAIVEIVRKKQHPLYKKLLIVSKKYQVDMGEFTPKVGDTAKIEETRPMSKNKYFRIIKVTEAK